MSEPVTTRGARIRATAIATLPGLGVILIGLVVTAWMIIGWGLGRKAHLQAEALVPYVGLPLMIIGTSIAIERGTAAFRGNRP